MICIHFFAVDIDSKILLSSGRSSKFKVFERNFNDFGAIFKVWGQNFVLFRISRSDLEDSKRTDSKFENRAQLENAIPGVYDSKISILGFRIQKLQKFDFMKIDEK